MRAVDILRKKRDGCALSTAEIEAFVRGATTEEWPDYQLSALLTSIVIRGMNDRETADLTGAMVHSGEKLDLSDIPGVKVDKHSTGGVGDKTSLILAPLAAACGVVVPMMSGRGLGHSGGTLDKLEAIGGFRVHLEVDEFRAALREVGCALVGQTKRIAPADKKLYALRDVTATVESIPLITASILSKKVAEGISALVLDVKCGKGAFMKTRDDARQLAESLVNTAAAHGVRTEALITGMDRPLGRMVGHSLEVIEAIEVLKGKGPGDLVDLSCRLAARMVLLAGRAATPEEAVAMVEEARSSGRGLEKFRAIVARQGGDPAVIDDYFRLPSASNRDVLRADRTGYLQGFDAEKVGVAVVRLGGGRARADHSIHHGVGIVLHKSAGHPVRAGEMIAEIHHDGGHGLEDAKRLLTQACHLGDGPPVLQPLVLEEVHPAEAAE